MPTQGDLYIAPFTDEMLYLEQTNKAQFWQQKSFYSLDLSSLKETVRLEYLSQPIKVCKHFVFFINHFVPWQCHNYATGFSKGERSFCCNSSLHVTKS